MCNRFCSRRFFFDRVLCGVAALGLSGAVSTAFAAVVCVGTPAAAIRSAGASTLPVSVVSEGKGYRVSGIRWDSMLQQSWATIVSCGHPEWPGVSLRVRETDHASHGLGIAVREDSSPLVRAGDIVELWRQEDLLRIEVGGVAEQSGRLGESIRVRLLRPNGSGQSMEEQFRGIVRGPADVEIQP
jgi:hypothetical protein